MYTRRHERPYIEIRDFETLFLHIKYFVIQCRKVAPFLSLNIFWGAVIFLEAPIMHTAVALGKATLCSSRYASSSLSAAVHTYVCIVGVWEMWALAVDVWPRKEATFTAVTVSDSVGGGGAHFATVLVWHSSCTCPHVELDVFVFVCLLPLLALPPLPPPPPLPGSLRLLLLSIML